MTVYQNLSIVIWILGFHCMQILTIKARADMLRAYGGPNPESFRKAFEKVVCAFFITAFFTLMQSWVWLCKVPADLQKKNTNLENIRYDEI